jgi:hypothetical protein
MKYYTSLQLPPLHFGEPAPTKRFAKSGGPGLPRRSLSRSRGVRSFVTALLLFVSLPSPAQFLDNFGSSGSPEGWSFATGDGSAIGEFKQKDGIASYYVDATHDKLGIWWALLRRPVSGLDMKKLVKPEYELRLEARVHVSHAPRRVNLHFNHQRTTDFHSHLMEYDIPDTVNWYVISMTTRDFEVQEGDKINAQLALMDWGLGKYRVDLDYFKVDVVNRNTAAKDLGNPLVYHPAPADPAGFREHADVVSDAVIDAQFRDINFDKWHTRDASGTYTNLLTVSGTQWVIMRWDLSKFKGKKIPRSGLLELSPFSVQRSPEIFKDFGMVRVAEIIGGSPSWDEKTVTYDSFVGDKSMEWVVNTQMVIDDSLTWNKNGKVLFTLSQPVMQRLIDGKTFGLAIKPLGAVNASFYSKDNRDPKVKPRLYFDVE